MYDHLMSSSWKDKEGGSVVKHGWKQGQWPAAWLALLVEQQTSVLRAAGLSPMSGTNTLLPYVSSKVTKTTFSLNFLRNKMFNRWIRGIVRYTLATQSTWVLSIPYMDNLFLHFQVSHIKQHLFCSATIIFCQHDSLYCIITHKSYLPSTSMID